MSQPAAAAATSSSYGARQCETSISLALSFLDKADFHSALQACRRWHSASEKATAWPCISPSDVSSLLWRSFGNANAECPFEKDLSSMRSLTFDIDDEADRARLAALPAHPVWSRVQSLELRSCKQLMPGDAERGGACSECGFQRCFWHQTATSSNDDAALEAAARLPNVSMLTLALGEPSEAVVKSAFAAMAPRLLCLKLVQPTALPQLPSLKQLRSLHISWGDAKERTADGEVKWRFSSRT